MNPQTFRAATLEEARRSAHKTLGENARILVAKRVTQSGLRGLLGGTCFEVSALPEEEERAAPPAAPRHFARDAYLAAPAVTPRATAGANDISQLRSELRGELRGLREAVSDRKPAPDVFAELEALHARFDQFAEASAPKGKRNVALEALGVEGPAKVRITRAVAQSEGDEIGRLEAVLSGLFEVAPSPIGPKGPRTISLIGPSGVGKTTTAAKIAARAAYDHDLTVTLVACDTFRVGAEAQLARYAELMGVKFAAAQTASELAAIIREAKTDLVICDHTGQPQDDQEDAPLAHLLTRNSKSRPREVLLCLPANVRAADAAHFSKLAAKYKPTALVVTKVDETGTPAGLVHATVAAKLPLALVCHGPRVPEDVEEPTIQSLVQRVLEPARRRGGVK